MKNMLSFWKGFSLKIFFIRFILKHLKPLLCKHLKTKYIFLVYYGTSLALPNWNQMEPGCSKLNLLSPFTNHSGGSLPHALELVVIVIGYFFYLKASLTYRNNIPVVPATFHFYQKFFLTPVTKTGVYNFIYYASPH